MMQCKYQTEREYAYHMRAKRQKKGKKISVVPPTDTVVHPRTVMVKSLNTMITNTTVRASGRPVEPASHTPGKMKISHVLRLI